MGTPRFCLLSFLVGLCSLSATDGRGERSHRGSGDDDRGTHGVVALSNAAQQGYNAGHHKRGTRGDVGCDGGWQGDETPPPQHRPSVQVPQPK